MLQPETPKNIGPRHVIVFVKIVAFSLKFRNLAGLNDIGARVSRSIIQHFTVYSLLLFRTVLHQGRIMIHVILVAYKNII